MIIIFQSKHLILICILIIVLDSYDLKLKKTHVIICTTPI